MGKEIIRIPTHQEKCLFATANPSAFGVCIGENMVDVKLLLRARHESTCVQDDPSNNTKLHNNQEDTPFAFLTSSR
jgi:hypothetical protein